jgi:hypothetical protein
MDGKCITVQILVGTPEVKRPLQRPRRRRKDTKLQNWILKRRVQGCGLDLSVSG